MVAPPVVVARVAVVQKVVARGVAGRTEVVPVEAPGWVGWVLEVSRVTVKEMAQVQATA